MKCWDPEGPGRIQVGRKVSLNSKEIALFRFGDRVVALYDKCSHAGGELHLGDIEEVYIFMTVIDRIHRCTTPRRASHIMVLLSLNVCRWMVTCALAALDMDFHTILSVERVFAQPHSPKRCARVDFTNLTESSTRNEFMPMSDLMYRFSRYSWFGLNAKCILTMLKKRRTRRGTNSTAVTRGSDSTSGHRLPLAPCDHSRKMRSSQW